MRLIKVNENGDVMRDKNGLCVLCKPGEPGEFIGKIVKNHPSRGFDGYVDKEATQKKIAHDVMYVFFLYLYIEHCLYRSLRLCFLFFCFFVYNLSKRLILDIQKRFNVPYAVFYTTYFVNV